MKKLDDFGIWLSERMFREGGWIDNSTKMGLWMGLVYVLAIVVMMMF